MNKQHLYGLINPFERIAGLEALLWGLAGMVVSTALSFYSGWHYHGLLHFGPAPNPAWWCYAVEHLAVWLIPAVMFYLGGLLLSRSRIRMVDVLGTVVFAQLYNPQIQISAESETKRSIFRKRDKTKRSKKESAQHSKSRDKSFVMTSVSAL